MRGIITSRRMQLGRWRATIASPSAPSIAVITAKPRWVSMRALMSAMSWLSSTMRIVSPMKVLSARPRARRRTRARAGSGARVAAMRRAVLLARTKPVPRASKAEGPAAQTPPQTSRRRAGRELDAAGGGERSREREATADAQAAGDVERADAARGRVDDRVAVDDDEARASRPSPSSARSDPGRQIGSRRGARRDLGEGRRRVALDARGAAASDDLLGAREHGQAGAVRDRQAGAQDRRDRDRAAAAHVEVSAIQRENLQSGSSVARQCEGPGLERVGKRPMDGLETAPDGRGTEGIHAQDDTCVDICRGIVRVLVAVVEEPDARRSRGRPRARAARAARPERRR